MRKTSKTVTFRCTADKINTLDSLAIAQRCSRSDLINEALSNHVELCAYQDALVRKGLDELQSSRIINHHDIAERLEFR